MLPNADQVGGLIRAFTPFAVMLASHFGIGEPVVTITAGALATFVTAVWSVWTNKPGTVIPTKGE